MRYTKEGVKPSPKRRAPMDKKLVQIKLSLALWDRLHAAALADGRSITNYITRLIEKAINEANHE